MYEYELEAVTMMDWELVDHIDGGHLAARAGMGAKVVRYTARASPDLQHAEQGSARGKIEQMRKFHALQLPRR